MRNPHMLLAVLGAQYTFFKCQKRDRKGRENNAYRCKSGSILQFAVCCVHGICCSLPKNGTSSSFVAGCNAFARGSLFSLLSGSPCKASLSSLADCEAFLVEQNKMLM